MDILKICGTALLAAVCALVAKHLGSPVHTALALSGIVALVMLCLPKISDIVNTAIAVASDGAVSDVFPVVLKVCAVALICEVASEICSACDAPSLSKAVTAAGRFEMIFLALPLFTRLYAEASSFLAS